jgi:hypothetical protein
MALSAVPIASYDGLMGFGKQEDSGKLWVDGDVVRYESKTYDSWHARIADIRLIGEMTNQNGPSADDYFICVVATADGCWLQASFYADGRDDLLSQLGERLGAALVLQLCNSTDFASRILWPPHLVGQPMFKFTDVVPRGFFQRLRHLVVPENVQTLSEIAIAEVQRVR